MVKTSFVYIHIPLEFGFIHRSLYIKGASCSDYIHDDINGGA